MSELIAASVLLVGIILGCNVALKFGVLAPASVYIWFLNVDLALFLYIVFARLDKADYIFSAMPWPPFFSVVLPTVIIYAALIFVGWLSVLRLSKQKLPNLSNVTIWKIPAGFGRNLTSVLVIFWIGVFCMELLHFWEVDKSVVWSNSVYLGLRNPEFAGIQTLWGKAVHYFLRPLGLLLLSAGTFFWIRRKKLTSVLFFFLAIYPFVLALAENSRWVPLYIASMLAVVVFLGKAREHPLLVPIGGIIGVLLYFKVLAARNTPYQGLEGTFVVLRQIFSEFQFGPWFLGLMINIFKGAQGLANALLMEPQYPVIFKLLSFSPTISPIDNFDKLVNVFSVRITSFNPMNIYAEAYLFGVPYFALLLVVLGIWLRMMTKMFLRKDMLGTSFAIISYWLVFFISQYPVRNSMRWIYISLVGGILADRIATRVFLRKESAHESILQKQCSDP